VLYDCPISTLCANLLTGQSQSFIKMLKRSTATRALTLNFTRFRPHLFAILIFFFLNVDYLNNKYLPVALSCLYSTWIKASMQAKISFKHFLQSLLTFQRIQRFHVFS
jgi:hypothetical protein